MSNLFNLLILIPAFNEAACIRQVVIGVQQAVPEAHILVIDDGSVDDTALEAAKAGAIVLRHPFNMGIGGTVQTGLKFACRQGYEQVVRVDGDGQHNPAHIDVGTSRLAAGQSDIVFGSRFLGSDHSMRIPPGRRVGISLFALVVSLLTGQRATDTTSGFFGMNRRAMALLAEHMPQDYPEVESRIILHKAGLRVSELPTPMRNRRTGSSSINFGRSIYYAFKVTIAALITAFKEIPIISEELPHASYPYRAAGDRDHLESRAGAGDHPADSQRQIT
jgi:glycosyltransferase involved in cell wall biosynthesis